MYSSTKITGHQINKCTILNDLSKSQYVLPCDANNSYKIFAPNGNISVLLCFTEAMVFYSGTIKTNYTIGPYLCCHFESVLSIVSN